MKTLQKLIEEVITKSNAASAQAGQVLTLLGSGVNPDGDYPEMDAFTEALNAARAAWAAMNTLKTRLSAVLPDKTATAIEPAAAAFDALEDSLTDIEAALAKCQLREAS